jgi:hypothetical protein
LKLEQQIQGKIEYTAWFAFWLNAITDEYQTLVWQHILNIAVAPSKVKLWAKV